MMYVFRILAPLVCVLGVACNSDSEVTMPCSRPAFTLFPQLDTIAVGATLQYETRFPTGQSVPTSGLAWSSSNTQMASVDNEGLATARSTGVVQIHAKDRNSPPTCPDQWYGTLVVR
jgi:hypothetical protein